MVFKKNVIRTYIIYVIYLYYLLKSLLYSNIGIVLGNTLINIARRSLSKRRYLSFKSKSKDS